MTERSRKSVLMAKIQSAPTTDAVPVAADDAMIVYDFKADPDVKNIERQDQGLGLSRLQEQIGDMKYKISFSCELRGSGAAGTAPKGLGALLKASGHSETISAGVSVTYAPRSSSDQWVTVYGYVDGRLYKCVGCQFNVSIEGKSGENLMLKFEGESLYTRPIDSTFPSSYSPNTTLPLKFRNVVAMLDSYTPVLRELSLSPNNVVTSRPDANQIWGFQPALITDRNPGGKMTIEAIALATKDYWAKFDTDTLMALSIVLGSTAGNICTITATYCKLRNIPKDDADGIVTHPLEFQMARTPLTDGSEYTIVFT